MYFPLPDCLFPRLLFLTSCIFVSGYDYEPIPQSDLVLVSLVVSDLNQRSKHKGFEV